MALFKHTWRRLKDSVEEQVEMQERLALLNRPWAEEFLHWSADGELHGHLVPPRGWRRYSVTRGGWCQHGRALWHPTTEPSDRAEPTQC